MKIFHIGPNQSDPYHPPASISSGVSPFSAVGLPGGPRHPFSNIEQLDPVGRPPVDALSVHEAQLRQMAMERERQHAVHASQMMMHDEYLR